MFIGVQRMALALIFEHYSKGSDEFLNRSGCVGEELNFSSLQEFQPSASSQFL
jgi:hypothetical protein